MIGSRKLSCFIGAILSLTLATAAWSVSPPPLPTPYDWGTEGVADTSRVKNVLQLTDNPTDNPYKDSIYGEYDSSQFPHQNNIWSQDGKWIVYVSEQDGPGSYNKEICKIKSDGSGFKRLTNNSTDDSNATFASDGMIYFVRHVGGGGEQYIWRMDAEGGDPTDLKIPGYYTYHFYYKVSPDAKKIAYQRNNELYVINSDGSGTAIQVSGKYDSGGGAGDTNLKVQPHSFDWSPDSKWIVYSANDGTGHWLYKADSSTAAPDNVNTDSLTKIDPTPAGTLAHRHWYPRWSPDGKKISYRAHYTSTIIPRNEYFLNIIDPDGKDLGTLDTVYDDTVSGWGEMHFTLSWSPDSNWIAYGKQWTESPFNWSIFIANTSGTPTPVQLTTSYDDVMPHWSPLGNQILFQEKSGSSETRDSGAYNADLLLLNLYDNYGGYTFPWHMFLPAVQGVNK